jgi:hypothetical protein
MQQKTAYKKTMEIWLPSGTDVPIMGDGQNFVPESGGKVK